MGVLSRSEHQLSGVELQKSLLALLSFLWLPNGVMRDVFYASIHAVLNGMVLA